MGAPRAWGVARWMANGACVRARSRPRGEKGPAPVRRHTRELDPPGPRAEHVPPHQHVQVER
eukprot:scaffold132540_cov43-Phaeocystis_antarctica.AAC.1